MPEPTVSILMPVYNAARFLRIAIDSILTQTYTDFELVIIDDGCVDGSVDIIHSYDDERIVYIRNESNLGIVQSLNKGLSLAKGKYIARMDADDIAMPERLREQMYFLDKHPDVGICGCNAMTIDADGNGKRIWFYESQPELVRVSRTFVCPFLHPTIMVRREILLQSQGYAKGTEPAEDYELWIRVLQMTNGANIPKVLLHYRTDSGSYSERKKKEALLKLKEVFLSHADILGSDLDNIDLHVRSVYGDWGEMKQSDLKRMVQWKNNLIDINNTKKNYDAAVYQPQVAKYIVNNLLKIMSQNGGALRWKALWTALTISPAAVLALMRRKIKSEKAQEQTG